jgi:outer membrane protein assembly factor BamB
VTAERLAAAFRPPSRTLIVLLNAGRVADVDAAGKTLWQVEGLKFPLDAQYLPGDRVLVAEYEGGRVSERNRKGEVVWEKKVLNPIVAQRLPNGNTFIATSSRLLEVDPSGREVWEQPPPQRGRVMKARRLRNGDVAVVTMLGGSRFFVIDRDGNIRRNFAVELSTSGGRLDVLRNGHVLMPERGLGRVAEYDKTGKVVWQARFTDPVAVVRLARGHVLVTGMQSQKAVELDRRGKVVWEHKADSRLTRAWRH